VADVHAPQQAMAMTFVLQDEEKETEFPLSPGAIAEEQRKDKVLRKKPMTQGYDTRVTEGIEVTTHNSEICVPKSLEARVIARCHECLVHPGMSGAEETIRQVFAWPGLSAQVKKFCRTCGQCQVAKKPRKRCGHPPPREADTDPWKRVNVGLVGPFDVRTPAGTHTLRAMAVMDPATNWFEIAPVPETAAEAAMETFNNAWPCCCPRPKGIGTDDGSEPEGLFKQMCSSLDTERHMSSAHNPQSQGTIERVHQVLENSSRAFELENQELSEHDPWMPFLSACAWAIRSTHQNVILMEKPRRNRMTCPQSGSAQLVGMAFVVPMRHRQCPGAAWARQTQSRAHFLDKSLKIHAMQGLCELGRRQSPLVW
jgi:hypothetical protein